MTNETTAQQVKAFHIVQTATGNAMWIGRATDEGDAHERHARAAGYASQADLDAAIGADAGVECHELELLTSDGRSRIWAAASGALAHETYLDATDEPCEIWDGDCDGYDPDGRGYESLIE
jgi:hypothetical protein